MTIEELAALVAAIRRLLDEHTGMFNEYYASIDAVAKDKFTPDQLAAYRKATALTKHL